MKIKVYQEKFYFKLSKYKESLYLQEWFEQYTLIHNTLKIHNVFAAHNIYNTSTTTANAFTLF